MVLWDVVPADSRAVEKLVAIRTTATQVAQIARTVDAVCQGTIVKMLAVSLAHAPEHSRR